MKILHIIVDLDVGGAETMLKHLIEANPEGIANTVVVSLTSVGQIGQQLRSRGVRVCEFGMRSAFSSPVALWRLVRLIRHYRPQVIQTWMYHADLLGGLAARLEGPNNLVWGVRRSNVSAKSLGLTWLIMKACAVLSRSIPNKIICVAEAGRKVHISAGYDASRIVVIPNGFEFEQLTATAEQRIALRKACGFIETDTVIGCVGRFDSDKGQDIFVRGAAIVAQDYPYAKFLMVGRDCDSNNVKLCAWLQEAGLMDQFVLLGERHDIPVCLSAMDVFCMPSRTEGFPNGLGEAMAMGLPCVATQVGDTSLLTGNTAVLVPPQDEKALANGLLAVVRLTSEQRCQMGQAAKTRVLQEFSIEKAAARFSAVYQGLVSEGET